MEGWKIVSRLPYRSKKHSESIDSKLLIKDPISVVNDFFPKIMSCKRTINVNENVCIGNIANEF